MTQAKHQGFTLLELMITITIAAILVLIAVPSFKTYSNKQAVRAAVTTLQNDLLLARSRAVYGGKQIVVCPGDATNGCSRSTDWQHGWIIFADANTDHMRQDDELLVREGMGVSRMAIQGTAGRTYLRFYPDGSAPGSNSSISFCGNGGPILAKKLVISNLGRIRRENVPDLSAAKCPG